MSDRDNEVDTNKSDDVIITETIESIRSSTESDLTESDRVESVRADESDLHYTPLMIRPSMFTRLINWILL